MTKNVQRKVPTLADMVAGENVNDAEVLLAARSIFTPEASARAAESRDAAAAYAKEALAAWQAGEREGKRPNVYAAMAAYAAVEAGWLTDGPKGKDAAEGVQSPTEWGEAWITTDHPEGVSRQMVDTWIRAGEAIRWGVDPESPEGKRLIGGLAQSKEWNAARKAIRTTLADEAEAGNDPEPEAVATMVTERIAEVRAEAEAAEAERKAKRAAEKLAEAERIKARLAAGSADDKSGNLPESLAERVALAEQVIAGLRVNVAKERAILEDLAERITVALAEADAA